MSLDNSKRNYSEKLKKLNFIGLLMVVIISITSLVVFSGAWIKKSGTITGEINFSKGIKAEVKNLSVTNQEFGEYANLNILISKYFDGANTTEYTTAKILNPTNFSSVTANQILTILNPSITPKEDSLPYYLRSKWIITVNGEELEESEWLSKANIQKMPSFNDSVWKLGSDNYYYNTINNTELNGKETLNVNTSGEIVFFGNSDEDLQIKIAESGNYNNTVVNNMKTFSIELRVEVVESTGDYITENDWQPTTGLIETKDIENFSYYIDNEDNLYLLNYLGKLTDIKVPYSFNLSAYEYNAGRLAYLNYKNESTNDYVLATSGKTLYVKAIGKETDEFYTESFNKNLEKIELAEGIKQINKYAFNNSLNLEKLVLPSTLEVVQPGAFENCLSLQLIELKNNSNFVYQDFALIGNSTDLIFYSPSSTDNIYTIGSSITNIYESAFYGNSNIKVINLSNVQTIGKKAFYRCSNLEQIVIPSTVNEINELAFEECSLLTYIDVKTNTLNQDYILPKIEDKRWYKNGKELIDSVISKTNALGVYSLKKADVESLGVSEDWEYISEDEKIWLTKYIGVEKETLNIPSYITSSTGIVLKVYGVKSTDGASVISLDKNVKNLIIGLGIIEVGENAFESLTTLENVSFTSSIEKISNNAFKNCTNIITIDLSHLNRITVLGDSAFENCSNVELLYLSDNLISIGNNTFKDCIKIGNTIVLSASNIETIGEGAFENCQNLPEFAFSQKITVLNNRLFYGCVSLKTAVLPEILQEIGASVFQDCFELYSIEIPKSVTYINRDVFKGCKSLSELITPFIGKNRDDSETETSVLGYFFGQSLSSDTYQEIDTTYQKYSEGQGSHYYVPNSLSKLIITDDSTIPYGAFSYLYNFYSFGSKTMYLDSEVESDRYILLPDNQELNITLSDNIVYNTNITGVYISKNVRNITSKAFNDTRFLKAIKVDSENANYSNNTNDINPKTNEPINALYNKNCTILIKFPEGYSVTTFTCSSEVAEIGDYAFYKSSISIFNLSQNINKINENSFLSISDLIYINIEGDINTKVSGNCNLNTYEKIYYNDNYLMASGNQYITFRGKYATDKIESTNYWDYISIEVENSTIHYITKYKGTESEVTIPNYLVDDDLNFIEIYGLKPNDGESIFTSTQTSIIISDKIKEILEYSFSNSSINTIDIPENIVYINNYAFNNIPSLTTITVDTNNEIYKSIDGILYSNNSDCDLIKIPEGYLNEKLNKTIFIDQNAKVLTTNSINNVTNLKGLNLPSVTNLEENAITNLDNIVWIYFGKDLTAEYDLANIKNQVWYKDADELESTSIKYNDFYCVEKASTTIYWDYENTDSKNYLTNYKANKTQSITDLYVPSKIVNINNNTIIDIIGVKTLSLSSYKQIIELIISEGITELKESSLSNNIYLQNIYIDSTISILENSTFYNCTSLIGITLPNTLQTIGNNVFENCTSITNLVWLFFQYYPYIYSSILL